MGLLEGVVGLVSFLIGVNSNDPPCSQDWVAWVATEGTISKGELSVASPTGYGLTREDPLLGEVEEAAELEMGIAAAWASRALSLGNSGAHGRKHTAHASKGTSPGIPRRARACHREVTASSKELAL